VEDKQLDVSEDSLGNSTMLSSEEPFDMAEVWLLISYPVTGLFKG
jgi:hypothetical protein